MSSLVFSAAPVGVGVVDSASQRRCVESVDQSKLKIEVSSSLSSPLHLKRLVLVEGKGCMPL